MAKGTGTYDDPIICDGLFSKTIDGVKKFFKIKTGSSVDTSQFVKKSGDVLTGTIFSKDTNNSYIYLFGGKQEKNACLLIYGSEFGTVEKGSIELRTKDDIRLACKNDGSLTWNGKNILRSVNGAVADNTGNVNIDTRKVSYVASRDISGTWTLTNLKISTPLYILYSAWKANTGYSNSGAWLKAVTGTNDGITRDEWYYYFGSTTNTYANTHGAECFIIIPTSTTVTLEVVGNGDDDHFLAYQ